MKRLIVLTGVVGISAAAVLVRWSTAPSMVLVLYRMTIAVLLLLPSVLLKGRGELKSMTKKEWLLTVAAGCCLGLHFSAFFESLRHTSIASAVLLSDVEVLFTALGSILIFRKKLNRQCWLAVALALIGAALVALADSGGESSLWGNALALGSTFLLALYTMIGASVRSRISNTTYTFVAYGCAAVTVLVISLVSGTPLTGYGANNLLTALGMAVLCTLLGHSVFTWGLKYLPPAYISTVKLLDPVFSALWGLLLFAEKPSLQVIVGGVIVIVGVFLYGRATEEE
ncbi:MAG: EamA/RhaT family transporter [Ruminococcaceae bacterium]|nr:EamA/RhaT family transporter [Oscillospiraceae bacterium]